MIRQHKMPTILGLGILIFGIVAGLTFINTRQTLKLSASVKETPKDTRITNIKDTSFTVSWVTEKKTRGFVAFGKTESLGQIASNNLQAQLHHVTLTGLLPNTNYFFKVGSGADLFDNNGKPHRTKTAPTVKASVSPADPIFGKITNPKGEPAPGAIIYISFPGSSPVSTTTDSTGSWFINLSTVRTTDLASLAAYGNQTTLEILARDAKQLATGKIQARLARPVPTMTLGKNYNFASLKIAQFDQIPISTVEVPQEPANPPSRFPLGELEP